MKICGMDPISWGLTLLEIWKFYFYKWSHDCKFAIKTFFHWLRAILYFLLTMQIWNGCNVLNNVGMPHKRYQCKPFISEFKMKVVEWIPRIGKFLWKHFWVHDQICWMDHNIWFFRNSTFPCIVQWYPSAFLPRLEGHLNMLIYSIFFWKCRFEMVVMCLILQETP